MGKLVVVPTPIGNLEDITIRALKVLKDADLILAEDTRTAGKLLGTYDIETPVRSHHKDNEHKDLPQLIRLLKEDKLLALISEAGTPGISDPGFLLVRACLEQGIEIETLPGPTALIPALVNSGIPCDRFHFEGFLPVKKHRNRRLDYLAALQGTIVIYESPHRLLRTLRDLVKILGGDREASISRELTKIHEETVRGTLSELSGYFGQQPPRGEFVIIIGEKSTLQP